jgi:hypothetical protein
MECAYKGRQYIDKKNKLRKKTCKRLGTHCCGENNCNNYKRHQEIIQKQIKRKK